ERGRTKYTNANTTKNIFEETITIAKGNSNLGMTISIVGGRGMGSRLSSGEVMRGIFIKHILEDSPAGKNGTLKTGDRIVEVDGIDLRDASHEQAVEAIQKAGNPAVFMRKELMGLSEQSDGQHQGLPPPPSTALFVLSALGLVGEHRERLNPRSLAGLQCYML
uniref:PDZ domain-containing protein n=1 Tax=Coturnix japonica TaxID=93934 RepID=A0A8C2TVX2_COTJA